jgi:hypothetical protein
MELAPLTSEPAHPHAAGTDGQAYTAGALIGDGSADKWVRVSHAVLAPLLGQPASELIPRMDKACPDRAARKAALDAVRRVQATLLEYDGLLACTVQPAAPGPQAGEGVGAAATVDASVRVGASPSRASHGGDCASDWELVIDALVPLNQRYTYQLLRKTKTVAGLAPVM